MRGPGADFRVIARAVQGMARVRSGQAPAWPLVSDRSARRDTPVSSVTSGVRSPGAFHLCSLPGGHSHA